jgi:anti-sigma regulatory factor (Ser/Thr protein kinase)
MDSFTYRTGWVTRREMFGTEFRHETLFYDDMDGFRRGTVSFLEQALVDGAHPLAVVSGAKVAALQQELGRDAERVAFVDMDLVGRNPARIIPLWREFAARRTGTPLRGIGEPVWAERSPAAVEEARRHEHLLNFAFGAAHDFWLLCPYNRETLDASVVEGADASHVCASDDVDYVDVAFGGELPAPPAQATACTLIASSLHRLRGEAETFATDAGLAAARVADFVLAVDEVATNSVRYGGGSGVAIMWSDDSAVYCELRDRGRFTDPLAGRQTPHPERASGRGLWIANQLCDLVQLRSGSHSTRVRLSINRPAA